MLVGNGIVGGPGGKLIWTQTVPPVRTGAWFRDDFDHPGTFTSTVIATGNAQITNANRPRSEFGVARLSTGAPGDLASIISGLAAASPFVAGVGNVTIDMRLALLNVADGVNNFSARFGFIDSPSATTAVDAQGGAYFETDYPNHGNSPVWFACTALGGVRTKVSTGVSQVAGTHQRLRIALTADGNAVSLVTFLINEIVVAVISTNLPIANGSIAGQMIKSLGAANVIAVWDYYEVTTTFANSR